MTRLKEGWSLGSRLQPNKNSEMSRYEKHNNILYSLFTIECDRICAVVV